VGDVSIHHILSVPVEANNNGGCKTSPTVTPPEAWLKQFVRKAPFSVHIHQTHLPTSFPLHATHWLFAQPENLTNGDPPP